MSDTNVDNRGSFTELLRTKGCGQFSVNISKPGVTKGQHWHHSKWEFFIVVSGRGLIQQRKLGSDEILEFYVSGDSIQAVHMREKEETVMARLGLQRDASYVFEDE